MITSLRKVTVEILETPTGFDVCVMNKSGTVLVANSFEQRTDAEAFATRMGERYGTAYQYAQPPAQG